MPNRHGVDFEQLVRNASDQGIDLNEIALLYEPLRDEEIHELKRHQLFVEESNACIVGRLNKEGVALFPDKVTGLYSLSA
jgi:hypothetical protein